MCGSRKRWGREDWRTIWLQSHPGNLLSVARPHNLPKSVTSPRPSVHNRSLCRMLLAQIIMLDVVMKRILRILPVSICLQSWPCATSLYIQIPLGESWSPRSADTPMSTGRTTTSAPRDLPGALRTQEPRSSLGQDPSTSVPWSWSCATALCIQIPPWESWSPKTWEHREDHHFCSNIWSKRDPPKAIRTQEPKEQLGTAGDCWGQMGTAGDRILKVSVCTPELTLCQNSPYSNSPQRELVSQGCWHTGLQEGIGTVRDSKTS